MKVICLIILLAVLFGKAETGYQGYLENRTDWLVVAMINGKKISLKPGYRKTLFLPEGEYEIKAVAYGRNFFQSKEGPILKACKYPITIKKGWNFIFIEWVFSMPGHKLNLETLK